VNHRLGAAIAALAMISAPAIALAGPSSWGIVTGWNNSGHNASVLDHLWSQIELHHTIDTVHLPIDWTQLPPGPCRQIAQQWDVLVAIEDFNTQHHHNHHGNGHHHQNQLLQFAFEAELDQMANNQCKITFVGGTVNGDGSTNMNTVAPSP
jgi:hypothetical protein